MAEKICTHCGYEGRGKIKTAGGGGIARVAGIVTMLPIYTLWKMLSRRGSKECPNCHLPMLVKLNSDAGQLARRKFDIELGFITPPKKKETPDDPLAQFGNEKPTSEPVKKKPINPDEW